MQEIINARNAVQKTIKDIEGYKKGQKALYRTFYEKKEALDEIKKKHALNKLAQDLCELDTSTIFYNKN
jgi:hypothetical protein